jgi:hypothetical protein
MVAGLGYIEEVRRLPDRFTAVLEPDPANRYNRKALAVKTAGGRKIGYVAPEVARHCFDAVLAQVERGGRVECGARRTPDPRRDATGIAAVLDFTAVADLVDSEHS